MQDHGYPDYGPHTMDHRKGKGIADGLSNCPHGKKVECNVGIIVEVLHHVQCHRRLRPHARKETQKDGDVAWPEVF